MNPQDELNALIGLFPEEESLVLQADHIPRDLTPEPYKSLLVHGHHMTVTMEEFHQSPVDVRVLEQRQAGSLYCRKITLVKSGTDQVVQFGIVRFNFDFVTTEIRDEILKGQTPLGRILINYNVLRHIDLGAIVKLVTGPGLCRYLNTSQGTTTYGRMATIFCNHRPALDLLEVSAPLD